MQAPELSSTYAGRVRMSDKIASFAAGIVTAKTAYAVIDDHGNLAGEITPQAVIDLLAGCGYLNGQPRAGDMS